MLPEIEQKHHQTLRNMGSAHQPAWAPLAMHVQFFSGAVLSLLAWWLENDLPLSPYQMAQYLLARHGAAAHQSRY
jgi:hypothetical protein